MQTMKKLVLILLAAGILTLAGCGNGASGGLTGTVNTDGSTSMADVVAVLQEAFREKYPSVTVNYSGTGSGAGVEAVLAGTCDIGLSSRELKDEEIQKGAQAHVVALDGVAVVINPQRDTEDLTLEQLSGIFTGAITDWEQVGGSPGPIMVCGREAGSGTRGAFEELLDVTDQCVYTNVYNATGDVIGSVAANPNAIGYASLSAVSDTVRAVQVEGVSCTEDTVRDGSYPIARPFLMVTKEGAEQSEAVQTFLAFAQSEEAAQYIALAGAVAP